MNRWLAIGETGFKVSFFDMQMKGPNSSFTLKRMVIGHEPQWRIESNDGLQAIQYAILDMVETRLELMYLSWLIEKDLLT